MGLQPVLTLCYCRWNDSGCLLCVNMFGSTGVVAVLVTAYLCYCRLNDSGCLLCVTMVGSTGIVAVLVTAYFCSRPSSWVLGLHHVVDFRLTWPFLFPCLLLLSS